MSIFGQVWLWSLAAFFAGAILTWGVLVLPLRKSVRNLESALAQSHADAARTPANAGAAALSAMSGTSQMTAPPASAEGTEIFSRPEVQPSSAYPGSFGAGAQAGHGDLHDDIDEDFAELDAQVSMRSYEPEPVAEPEPHEAVVEAEPELDDPYRAAATQYLTPVGSTPVEPDESYRTSDYLPTESLETFGQVEDAEGPFESVLEHEPEVAGYADPEPDPDSSIPALSRLEPAGDGAGALFTSGAEPHSPDPDWFDHEPAAERSAFEEPNQRTQYIGTHPGSVRAEAADEQPEPAPDEEPEHAVEEDEDESAAGGLLEVPELPEVPAETAVESTQVLPKRQPRESPRGGFDPPRPIQPSMRAVERRDPDLSGAHSGSLFEPSVQPNQVAAALATPEPPPAPPARQAAADSVPPGPFGPGSAMPRPGGGRPGDGFEVKASVTALRYCTDESAQFPRMVAEVWFRTAEDAERVGFRPLT